LSVPAPSAADLSLSEMLHVLDVARTLRRDQELVESELNKEELLASLRERLLAAAAAAGDNVSEAEVDAAIKIYFDNLHKYADPPLGISVALAHLYVLRRQVAVGLGTLALVLIGAWGLFWSPIAPFSAKAREQRAEAYNRQVIEQREAQIEAAIENYTNRLAAARSIAVQPRAIEDLGRLERQGSAAVDSRDTAELQRITSDIAELDMRMREEYELLIVSDPDRYSAVIRDYEDRLSGYYVIVEAHAAGGGLMPRSIHSRETDQTQQVTAWGELVPEEVYERLRQDKESDGVLDERLFAVKRRGWLDEETLLPAGDGQPIRRGGQITEW
jgi:hypothetical protein